MILSFKKQFREPILMGSKIHTIREDKRNRWKAGNKIHFATGVRTKNYECFEEGECKSVQSIFILYENKCSDYPSIWIADRKHLYAEVPNVIERLCINDGFTCVDDFLAFFPTDFKGKIIHWTSFKY